MQKRVHIFLARSSGFKGFQKRSFLKGKTFLGVSLFYKHFFWACSHPFTLVFFSFKSFIAGELEPHIRNPNRECRIKIVLQGGGFDGSITSVPIQFYFVVREWCQANLGLVHRCPCSFFSLICLALCFSLCFPADFRLC